MPRTKIVPPGDTVTPLRVAVTVAAELLGAVRMEYQSCAELLITEYQSEPFILCLSPVIADASELHSADGSFCGITVSGCAGVLKPKDDP